MSDATKVSLLRNFFAGYFHQDWDLSSQTWEGVVDLYKKDASEDDIRTLSAAILEYSEKFSNEKELEEKLDTELWCEFYPAGLGLTTRSWMLAVSRRLMAND